MNNPQSQDLIIIAFGALSFLGGMVFAGRAWSVGHRWTEPGTNAGADRIEGCANLRFGAAALLGGGCIIASGTLLATASTALLNGLPGVAMLTAVLGILVVVGALMRSGLRLTARAASVRVRDSLPKRPRLYLVWPPPPDDYYSQN